MKIYKDLYWSIISPQTLFRAWEIFRSDKWKKPDVAAFEVGLERNIFGLYRDLKARTYKHGPYRGFWIHDPKLRRIHKAMVRDRVLHHAVYTVIYPIFEKSFISSSFSCRINKGSHKGVCYLKDVVRKVSRNYTKKCFVLKCDIQKFFDNVDHDILIGIIRKRIKDVAALELIEKIIASYYCGVTERERERERVRLCREKAYPSAI